MARAPYPGADRNGLGASNDSMEEKDPEGERPCICIACREPETACMQRHSTNE